MTTATVRWIHSIQAFGSPSGGMSWPWQSGQSGQPRPESVARTMTPIVTSPRAVARVERGELLEAVHEAAILPRRHVPTDFATLSRDDPPTPVPGRSLALALVVAALQHDRLVAPAPAGASPARRLRAGSDAAT